MFLKITITYLTMIFILTFFGRNYCEATTIEVSQKLSIQLPIFPEAEGFGVTTPAGRGGKIIRVTTLSDNGKGSLREALEAEGPRVIVFEVAGIIDLNKHLYIHNPFVTIAGQTAPSPGITITNASLAIRTHDVLIQHLRIRVGDRIEGPEPGDRDGIKMQGLPIAPSEVFNVVIDHCSISWAIDEGISLWYRGIHDVTISNSIISENLSHSLHPKGEHSKGMLIGDHAQRVAVIRNLFAHNRTRNPAVKGSASALIVNNLIYNPGTMVIRLADYEKTGPSCVSIVGNVVLKGPSSQKKVKTVYISKRIDPGTAIYLSSNSLQSGTEYLSSLSNVQKRNVIQLTKPIIWIDSLTVLKEMHVKGWVLANSGARPWDRDIVDKRVVKDVMAGSGRIIDSQDEVGGFPIIKPIHRKLNLPADPNKDDDGDGYTNLEEWLHKLSTNI